MAQTQHPVGRLCNAVAVCHQQHRRALLPGQAGQQLDDTLTGIFIKVFIFELF